LKRAKRPQGVNKPLRSLDETLCGFYYRPASPHTFGRRDMSECDNVLSKIFTWWNGATIGTLFTIAKRGSLIGTDEFGNRYYQSRDTISYDGRKRRWVVYNGYAEATKVPPEWQGWLRYTYDEAPSEKPLPRKAFEKDHIPNLTGTPYARRPQGSLAAIGQRPAATGDYQAWTPE